MGRTKAGVLRSLAEWLLLARCELLVHAAQSSYAESAAAGGGVPAVVLNAGRRLIGASSRAPGAHCNDPGFARALLVTAKCGAPPGAAMRGREACPVALRLVPCAAGTLEGGWAMDSLLCIGGGSEASAARQARSSNSDL